MIGGDEIRAARERAGLTQQQLGESVGVGLRTVGNWERGETVPRNREAMLRRVLADHLADTGTAPLRTVADAEVVAEVARRISLARERESLEHSAAATTRAAGSAATDMDAVRDAVVEAFRQYVAEVDAARHGIGERGRKADPILGRYRAEFVRKVTALFDQARPISSEDVG